MKNIFLFILVLTCVIVTHAQKKLTPATKSAVTGIDLPPGSKQDGRLLSQSMAGFLMDPESDKRKTTLRTAEVLVLPPASLSKFTVDSLVQKLSSQNWKIIAKEGDSYLWIQKDNRFVIAYFSIETKETSLYFAETTSTPDFNTQAETTTSQPTAQSVVEPSSKAVMPAAQSVNQQTPQPDTQPTQNKTTNTIINSPIIGTWRRGTGGSLYGGRWSSTGYQYTFNTNGTYAYIIKTYVEDDPETLLTRESGTFAISGNTVTLDPLTNVIEAWSKSNGGDNYKALITRQNKPLEKIMYQFTLHYFPELKETGLVLIYNKETIRDGKYNASDAFPTGWRFSPAGPDFKLIILPGEQPTTTEEVKKEPAQQNAPIANGKFAFSTSNFNDGWVSTVQEDWVEVKKESMRVLLHYPKEGTIFPADPEPMTNAAWNILVGPRYGNLKNYKTSYIATYDRPYLGMGYATENITKKNVFVVLFRQGKTGWLEFVAPDKNTFIEHYKFDPETIQWDSNEDLLIPLVNMAGYNKFAVAASDLKGRWTSDFTGIQQMYYAYSGAYAGMNINQSNEEFVFNADNTYNWKLLVVAGMAGSAKANQVKSSGTFTLLNNWQVKFSMIETRARTYHAFWSCIKGVRILNLLDADFPGSGIYTKYGLAK